MDFMCDLEPFSKIWSHIASCLQTTHDTQVAIRNSNDIHKTINYCNEQIWEITTCSYIEL